jgi:arginase
VAVERGYECHACGWTFAAGLVRVPRAWGRGGGEMAEAASLLALPYPEAEVVARDTLEEQTAALAASLPERPIVLGGCCCAHTGAIRGLAERGQLAVVWLDAHGDLNTPETSPSGNPWGMPLRVALDEGSVRPEDVALVGARALDPPEVEFLEASGIDSDLGRALSGAEAVYVALDLDVLAPGQVSSFMPEPGGPSVAEVEAILRDVASRIEVAGLGLTAFLPDADSATLGRFPIALGL